MMHALRRELTGTLRNVATQLQDELEPGVYWDSCAHTAEVLQSPEDAVRKPQFI